MMEEKDDTILARWLAGNLNDEELKELENSEGFEDYRAIRYGMDYFVKPEYDKEALKRRIEENKTDLSQSPTWFRSWLKVAATLLILISVGYGLFFSTVTYETNNGEQLTVNLPDGTELLLAPATTIERKRFFWNQDKVVSLKSGEAFFKVIPGREFKVETDQGSVDVLGTAFDIRYRDNGFTLECYSGKVRFTNAVSQEQQILTKGQGLSLWDGTLDSFEFDKTGPDRFEGMSSFENAPLKYVLKELEVTYDIQFNYDDIDLDQRYTGALVHSNLNQALSTVLMPMDIEYEIGKENQINLK